MAYDIRIPPRFKREGNHQGAPFTAEDEKRLHAVSKAAKPSQLTTPERPTKLGTKGQAVYLGHAKKGKPGIEQ